MVYQALAPRCQVSAGILCLSCGFSHFLFQTALQGTGTMSFLNTAPLARVPATLWLIEEHGWVSISQRSHLRRFLPVLVFTSSAAGATKPTRKTGQTMSGTTLIHGHFQCRLHLGRNYVQNEDRLSPLCSSKGGAQPSKPGKAEPWEEELRCDLLSVTASCSRSTLPSSQHQIRKQITTAEKPNKGASYSWKLCAQSTACKGLVLCLWPYGKEVESA